MNTHFLHNPPPLSLPSSLGLSTHAPSSRESLELVGTAAIQRPAKNVQPYAQPESSKLSKTPPLSSSSWVCALTKTLSYVF